MALPLLTDPEIDALILARSKPMLTEIAQHQLNALSQGDELDAAAVAHTTASTPETRGRLRAAKAALLATDQAIATITAALGALDKIGATANSANRVRNRSNAAISAAKAAVVPDEPTP
jgi:hypothetical protein